MATTTETPAFSRRLREATWAKHQGLDPTSGESGKPARPGVFDLLFDGGLSREEYALWHTQQLFVYRSLEEAARGWEDHELYGRFVFPEVERTAALERDAAHLLGAGWEESLRPIDSVRAYADRIGNVAAQWGGGFVAHAYTRYLADLSGGLVFAKAVAEQYRFEGPGMDFYRFDGIGTPKEFKDNFRSLLDGAGFDIVEGDRIIDEVLHAYDLNGAMLDELADAIHGARGENGGR
ncbi:biliverdin-producing heme oxygenase [Salininema proteolyticum]|uniref:Heme oxygenase (Biliverdin-producing) n=1 Tax=Salininema proteolyticum TaxID=1607685 RepID=A0ABV8U407_9ACTN